MDLRLKIVVPIAFALVVIAVAFGFFFHLDLTTVKTLVGPIVIGIGFLAAVIWYAVDVFLYRPLLKVLDEYRPAMSVCVRLLAC